MRLLLWMAMLAVVASGLGACAERAGRELARRGDEIMVAGRLFHTGAPVVLWVDPGGYDGYRTEKRFVPWARAAFAPSENGTKGEAVGTPNRYGVRYAPKEGDAQASDSGLSAEEFERVRGGAWDLPTLQRCVDQFVLHYDVCGVSRQCFRVLHDMRGLSVHFMLDIDGTIYQTMDVKERAWHATVCNDRSVGVEIANIGAYSEKEGAGPLNQWYEPDPGAWGERSAGDEATRITIPERLGDGGVRRAGTYGPRGGAAVYGVVQGKTLRQFDLTPEQYESLIKLTATLCTVLPRIRCEYPRDAEGRLVSGVLSSEELARYSGVLGHYHIQENKIDPGPALDWDLVVESARKRMGARVHAVDAERGTE